MTADIRKAWLAGTNWSKRTRSQMTMLYLFECPNDTSWLLEIKTVKVILLYFVMSLSKYILKELTKFRLWSFSFRVQFSPFKPLLCILFFLVMSSFTTFIDLIFGLPRSPLHSSSNVSIHDRFWLHLSLTWVNPLVASFLILSIHVYLKDNLNVSMSVRSSFLSFLTFWPF